MNKKKMILTSLASVAILGAGFVASQPTFVRAEESPVDRGSSKSGPRLSKCYQKSRRKWEKIRRRS